MNEKDIEIQAAAVQRMAEALIRLVSVQDDVDGIGVAHETFEAIGRSLKLTAIRMYLRGRHSNPEYHRLSNYAQQFGVTKPAFHKWVQEHRPNEPLQ